MPAIATVGCMFILLTCHRLGVGGGRQKEGGKRRRRSWMSVCKLWPAKIRYHTTWNASIYPKHFRQHANLYSLGRFLFLKGFHSSEPAVPHQVRVFPPQSGGVSDRHLCLTVTHCVPICITTEARLWWQRWEQTEYGHDGDSFSHNVSITPFTRGNEARFVVRILATDHDFSRDNSLAWQWAIPASPARLAKPHLWHSLSVSTKKTCLTYHRTGL